MNYAFKMIVLGVLVLQGCQTTASKVEQNAYFTNALIKHSDVVICKSSKNLPNINNIFATEAKRRGLDCGIGSDNKTIIASKPETIIKKDKVKQEVESDLPNCPSSGNKHNCFGSKDLGYGSKYIGEWRFNKWHGKGTLFQGRAKFIGEFKDGIKDGQGTSTYDGFVEEGLFKNNQLVYEQKNQKTEKKYVEVSKPNTSSTKLDASKREANELRKKLASLEKQQKEQQQLKPKTVVIAKPKSEFSNKPINVNFKSITKRTDDIAVIIGNANYKKMGKDIPNVNPAYADAEGIKQYFMKAKGIKEGNIIYLKDATGSQLLGVFGNKEDYKGQLFNYIKPNKSNVYVYYAGHGVPSGSKGSAYIVPSDANAQTVTFSGYPLSTLYSNLGKLPAKSVTVILEACFSGSSQAGSLFTKSSPITPTAIAPFIPANVKVIAAGSERQMASWEEDSSHSLFTKYFLKAMSGEGDANKDGKVSDAELKEYLSDTMTYYARRYYGRDQKVQIHNGAL